MGCDEITPLIRPFFPYYGSKWRAALRYPSPMHDTIIEPFAGSAGYATRHYQRNVLLYDIDPIICGVWDYLIRSRSSEISSLPLKVGHVDDLKVCQEARWLIGFWLNPGSSSPNKSPSSWALSGKAPSSYWGERVRQRIAEQVCRIKHWQVFNKSFDQCDNAVATWFVDAPYQGKKGSYYRHKFQDYDRLGLWCRSRAGQVIVCEYEGAEWLQFRHLGRIKAATGPNRLGYSDEVIWTNDSVAKQVA